jgi:ATP-dependent Clp protease adaptor protein ClpS
MNYHPLQVNDTHASVIEQKPYSLIVWNDDINSFDWVIATLMEICNHSQEQAEQCAMLIHLQGKYAVKHGNYNALKPLCHSILQRGIGATVEATNE